MMFKVSKVQGAKTAQKVELNAEGARVQKGSQDSNTWRLRKDASKAT